tara:strand:+ start:3568 stop:4521 length:954 start_codon:yes stop_codon:yes gene_type:complete
MKKEANIERVNKFRSMGLSLKESIRLAYPRWSSKRRATLLNQLQGQEMSKTASGTRYSALMEKIAGAARAYRILLASQKAAGKKFPKSTTLASSALKQTMTRKGRKQLALGHFPPVEDFGKAVVKANPGLAEAGVRATDKLMRRVDRYPGGIGAYTKAHALEGRRGWIGRLRAPAEEHMRLLARGSKFPKTSAEKKRKNWKGPDVPTNYPALMEKIANNLEKDAAAGAVGRALAKFLGRGTKAKKSKMPQLQAEKSRYWRTRGYLEGRKLKQPRARRGSFSNPSQIGPKRVLRGDTKLTTITPTAKMRWVDGKLVSA